MSFKDWFVKKEIKQIKLLKLAKGCHYVMKANLAYVEFRQLRDFISSCYRDDIHIHLLIVHDIKGVRFTESK